MTAAVDAATRVALRERAAVLVDFDLADLVRPDDPADTVQAFLERDCELVRTCEGRLRWALTSGMRMRTFAVSPLSRLAAARRLVAPPAGPVQRALDRSLHHGWSDAELDRLLPEEARSLGVVASWWDGVSPRVPSPEKVRAVVERLNLFADVRAMAEDHFVGRADVLSDLHGHFEATAPRPYLLSGVGGIGKSALLARHLVDSLDRRRAIASIVDFDDAAVNPHYPMNIVALLVGQMAQQVDGPERSRLEQLVAAATDEVDSAATRDMYLSRASSRESSRWETIFAAAVGLVPPARRALVVMDTFEQVQRRGPSAVASVVHLIDGLCAHGAQVRVVVAGRAEVPELGVGRYLHGLRHDEAVRLLREFAGDRVDDAMAAALVAHLGTSPLTVRLTGQLLRHGDEGTGDLLALDVAREQVDAFLYDRVLRHLDPRLRRLAHPGLVLRRITPEIILHVLAEPCELGVHSEYDAEVLFAKLADEPMLVDRDPSGRLLTHRADVRALMLPQLLRDPAVDHARVQAAAIRYYEAQGGFDAKVEELYHRLLMGQPDKVLDAHWDARAAFALVPFLDELPTASRVYLAAHVPETYLRPEDRRLVDDTAWATQIEPQVMRLISTGAYDVALGMLRERRGPEGEPLLPGLEVEALEYLGDLPEAASVARRQRRLAALRGDSEAAVTFGLHLARLSERIGDIEGARAVLEETLTTAAREPSLDRLRVLVAWLGVDRRSGASLSGVRDAREEEAVGIRDHLGPAVQAVPALLRDMAAETGPRSPTILMEALQTVGLDAQRDGDVPAALQQLSAEVAAPDQDFDMVADLTGLADEDEGEVHWERIAAKSRGDTGRALSELLSTFDEPAAEALKQAVTQEFQLESDAALFAEERESGPASD